MDVKNEICASGLELPNHFTVNELGIYVLQKVVDRNPDLVGFNSEFEIGADPLFIMAGRTMMRTLDSVYLTFKWISHMAENPCLNSLETVFGLWNEPPIEKLNGQNVLADVYENKPLVSLSGNFNEYPNRVSPKNLYAGMNARIRGTERFSTVRDLSMGCNGFSIVMQKLK